jgi:hypothetical protein
MLRNLFNVTVLTAALGGSVWLIAGGAPWFIENLLLVKAGLLAAIVFAFKIADSSDPERLSIWTGPVQRRQMTGH